MKALLALMGAFGSIFALLNAFGGIVSGIWLAILGHWGAIGLGLLGFFVSSFVLGLVLLPSSGLGLLAARAAQRGFRGPLLLFAGLSNLYVAAVVTAWSLWILGLFMSRADQRSWIPMLIWSYGVAIGPWAYMAQQEVRSGGGEASVATVFFAQIAYLITMLMLVFGHPSLGTAVLVFGTVMLAGATMQFTVGRAAMSRELPAHRSGFSAPAV